METIFPHLSPPIVAPFKSYYVVWKPVRQRTAQKTAQSLNRTMQYGNLEKPLVLCRIFFKFKSYYVVWKPIFFHFADKSATGLNRTMQYGNLETISILNAHSERFKSYYVVWKLSTVVKNRRTPLSFKSYYVVWKLQNDKWI